MSGWFTRRSQQWLGFSDRFDTGGCAVLDALWIATPNGCLLSNDHPRGISLNRDNAILYPFHRISKFLKLGIVRRMCLNSAATPAPHTQNIIADAARDSRRRFPD